MEFNYEEKLESHIKALESTYDRVIEILSKDTSKNEDGEIKLKDSQLKSYAEGTNKLVETADNIIERIRAKKIELDALKKPKDGDDNNGDDSIKGEDKLGDIETITDIPDNNSSDLATRVKG